MVSDERACTGSTGNRLQDRSFHFRVTSLIQNVAQCFHYSGAFQECFFDAVIYYQVHIALAITEFGIFKRVVSYSVFVFNDWQRFNRLCQYSQFLCMDTDFTHLCAEHETFDTDKVT